MKDLVVLCPDICWKATLEALLSRPASLGIREIDAEVRHIPGKSDGPTRKGGVELLRYLRPQWSHALLVFDHDGCGDRRKGSDIEADLDRRLSEDWADRAGAVVVEPELEEWLVGTHRWLPKLGGRLAGVDARRWWRDQGLWPDDRPKPEDPKRALKELLTRFDVPFSSVTYRKIAEGASLKVQGCQSRSYQRFHGLLQRWFPRG